MGTKMVVAFASIYIASIETQILSKSSIKPLEWKCFIDDILSLWNNNLQEIEQFIEGANHFHPTIKFTAEISNKQTTFLDTTVYKSECFLNQSIFDIHTHFKSTETFQYMHFSSCHPGVTKVFIKGGTLRLLRTNSSKTTFEEHVANFKTCLKSRGYPNHLVERTISGVVFTERQSALQPAVSVQLTRDFNETLAANTKPTFIENNIYGTSYNIF